MAADGEILSVDQAVERILADVGPVGHEWCPVDQAYGKTLADAALAREGSPRDPVSVMDGIAVDGDSTAPGDTVSLIGESAAGRPSAPELRIEAGQAVLISTGAVLPEGASAVVPREELERDGNQVRLARSETVAAGQWVRARHSDVRPGQTLLPAGHRIAPGDVALLASAGHDAVLVSRVPQVAIVCTGDELVAPGQVVGRGQVVSTNHLMLAQQVLRFGGRPVVMPSARDSLDQTRATLSRALGFDLVLTSGGISVGDHDHVAPALEALGLERRWAKLALRPGRPTSWFDGGEGSGCLALPGNPASSLVAMELLGRAAIRMLCGAPAAQAAPAYRPFQLGSETKRLRTRAQFVRARLEPGSWTATPLAEQRSGALTSIADFDVLLEIPAGEGRLAAGAQVRGVLTTPR